MRYGVNRGFVVVKIGNNWDEILKQDFESDEYLRLREFLKREYQSYTVYPPMHDIFNALKITDYYAVKAVILGQDPYHNPNQAHGLSFSVLPENPPPPSLVNIYKELNSDIGVPIPDSGCLLKWAQNGVLLLNASLTVRAHSANSHSGKGWESVTDSIICKLSARDQPLVFMLWGNFARSKKAFIDTSKHLVLECAHPSPLSAYNGFFGCRHFSKANAFLRDRGLEEVEWEL